MNDELNIGPSCHGGGATQNNYYSVTVKKMVIHGGPGKYDVQISFGWGQKLRSLFGKGPSEKEFEKYVRVKMLGEPIDKTR